MHCSGPTVCAYIVLLHESVDTVQEIIQFELFSKGETGEY